MHELFEFRLMQTDPNWSNVLYNQSTGKVSQSLSLSLARCLSPASSLDDAGNTLRGLAHDIGLAGSQCFFPLKSAGRAY